MESSLEMSSKDFFGVNSITRCLDGSQPTVEIDAGLCTHGYLGIFSNMSAQARKTVLTSVADIRTDGTRSRTSNNRRSKECGFVIKYAESNCPIFGRSLMIVLYAKAIRYT